MIKASNNLTGKLNASIIHVYPELENIEITPTVEDQELKSEMYGFDKVKVKGVQSYIDSDIKPEYIKDGVDILGVVGNVVELKGEEKTIKPTTQQQTVLPSENKNAMTKITVQPVDNTIDTNITPENIVDGVEILGVIGNYKGIDTSDATVSPSDVLEGKTVYINNQKIVGTLPNNGELEFEPSDEEQEVPEGYTTGGYIKSADITKLNEYDKCLMIANSIEDMSDYSDTTATAEDIVEGKTAYSNGERIVGTLRNYNLLIDTSISRSMKSSLQSMLVKAKDLDYSNVSGIEAFRSFTLLEEVSFKKFATNRTDFYNMFQGCTKLKKVEGMTPKAGKLFQYMFQGCTSLEEAPIFDCPKAIDFSFMFNACTSLREIPKYNRASSGFMTYGMKNMIGGCPNLSDTALDNVMSLCRRASNSEVKTLAYVGFSQEQAERCKTLSNYESLIAAGWTTGY